MVRSTTLLVTNISNISSLKALLKMMFLFPKVGFVSSPEGNQANLTKIFFICFDEIIPPRSGRFSVTQAWVTWKILGDAGNR